MKSRTKNSYKIHYKQLVARILVFIKPTLIGLLFSEPSLFCASTLKRQSLNHAIQSITDRGNSLTIGRLLMWFCIIYVYFLYVRLGVKINLLAPLSLVQVY